MQDFLEDIQEMIPKITKRKAYLIVCTMKWRCEKYWSFGLWKRDGPRYGISERQMSYLIALLVDYWYIKVVAKIRGSRGFICSVYKASSVMKEVMAKLRQGLNWLCVAKGNLTDRIKQFNSSHNTFDYLRTLWKVKYTKLIIDARYIVHKRAKKYENWVYDSEKGSALTLFEFLRIYNNRTLIEQSRALSLLGQ